MKLKKNVIIGAAILLAVLIISIICIIVVHPKDKIMSWDRYVSKYKNKTIKASTDTENYYAKEFILKNKKLYAVSNEENSKSIEIDGKKANFIMNNIIEVHVITYKDIQYVYIVNTDGKMFYLNNLKYSTSDKYELTELGNFKYIEKVELKENKIIAIDKDKNELELSNKIKSYTAYSG